MKYSTKLSRLKSPNVMQLLLHGNKHQQSVFNMIYLIYICINLSFFSCLAFIVDLKDTLRNEQFQNKLKALIPFHLKCFSQKVFSPFKSLTSDTTNSRNVILLNVWAGLKGCLCCVTSSSASDESANEKVPLSKRNCSLATWMSHSSSFSICS